MPPSESMLDRTPDLATLRSCDAITDCDVLVVGIRAAGDGQDGPVLVASGLDAAAGDELSTILATVGARTTPGSICRVPAPDSLPATSVLAVGVGGADDELDDERLRRAAGAAGRACRGLGVTVLALDAERPETVAVGAGLGSYRVAKVTADTDPADADDDVLQVLAPDAEAAVERAAVIVDCVSLARDLVNTPPNLLYPDSFARRAAELGTAAGVQTEILDENALAEGGYGGILGVGAGSSRPPRLLRMSYRVDGERPTVALVGKGVTFDTGGISIKPAAGMEKMTSDMGGAAAVVATVILAARLGVDVNVTATVPMAENMPSATAYRPGDVLTMYRGTTVEVQNTDAEGRLILADAITRACEDEPDYLLETATLTGAQMVALGTRTPGVMGADDFRDRVAALSRGVGENGWPMPLPEEIRDGLDSPVADLCNVTPTRWGGMLAAGLFLAEFVADGLPWAHVDIAGPAFNDSAAEGYLPKGGTGVPVRTFLAVLEDIADRG